MIFYQVLSNLLPVFLLIFIGWILGKKNWINPLSLEDMNRVVFYIAIPCLLFNVIVTNDTPFKDFGGLFSVYYIGIAVIYIAAFGVGKYCFKLSIKEAAVMAMASSFSNNLMVAFPVLQFTWGEEATLRLFTLITIHASLLWGITLILLEIDNKNKQNHWYKSLLVIFGNLIKNPILLAITFAIFWKMSTINVPAFFRNFTFLTGKMAAPLTLFVLGVRLTTFSLNENKTEPAFMAVMKGIVFPFVVWVLGRHVFKLDNMSVYVTTLMAATSMGVNPYILAQQYHVYERRVASAFLLSVILCFFVYLGLFMGFFAKVL